MSINEIINGQPSGGFPGLIPLVESYLDGMNVDVETRCELARYLGLIRGRASGELWTAAKWIRAYVRGHREYQMDSVVNEEVCYDLVQAVEVVTRTEGRGEGGLGGEMFRRDRRAKTEGTAQGTGVRV